MTRAMVGLEKAGAGRAARPGQKSCNYTKIPH